MSILDDKPVISAESQEVIRAFRILSSSRSGTGYGPNPISFTDLKAYLDFQGDTYLPKDILVDLIYRLDRRYIVLAVEQLKVQGGRKT